MPDASSSPARVKLWGVRGSIPVPGQTTLQYGGNTTCVEIRADGEIVILDAGTGIRALGTALEGEFGEKPIDVSLLITHMHWDHIQGFPFFAPCYHAKNRILIMGYDGTNASLRNTFAGQMAAPFFPVQMEALPGRVEVREIEEADFHIGRLGVKAHLVNHPGICVGYRVQSSGGSIAFLPDNEPYDGRVIHAPDGAKISGEALRDQSKAKRIRLLEFLHGVDLLIVDAQYTDQEYEGHVGWGHSSLSATLTLALDAEVKKVVLFHHDPTHDDRAMDQMAKTAQDFVKRSGRGLDVVLAREGDEFQLGK